MTRLIARLLVAVLLVGVLAPLGPVPGADAKVEGAILWEVDHGRKTITVTAKLQLYSGCSGDPVGTEKSRASACRLGSSMLAPPTQLFADKLKAWIERIWNKGYMYRCYELKVVVDIKLATEQSSLDPDRIAVRIDPSPTDIRSYVRGSRAGTKNWESDNPADAPSPANDGSPTTWSDHESPRTYAHEFGHIIGLDDSYRDVVGPNGETESVAYPNAPIDLMSTGFRSRITQQTINRLIKRNMPNMRDTAGKAVTDKDLVCDYKLESSNGQTAWLRGTKCNGKSGLWTIAIYDGTGSGPALGEMTFTLPEDGNSAEQHSKWTAINGAFSWDMKGRVIFVEGADDQPSKLSFATQIGKSTLSVGGVSQTVDATIPGIDLPLQEGKFCE